MNNLFLGKALEKLTERLVNVVYETMQPAHISLWLKQNEQRKKH